MITLTEQQVNLLLQYLGKRPYIETAGLINMLGSSMPKKEPQKEDKKSDK